jgi:hypothetical protein
VMRGDRDLIWLGLKMRSGLVLRICDRGLIWLGLESCDRGLVGVRNAIGGWGVSDLDVLRLFRWRSLFNFCGVAIIR